MKILLPLILIIFYTAASAQPTTTEVRTRLDESSVVKDSSGTIYPYSIWTKLVSSGNYIIKAIKPSEPSTEFLLIKLTEEQKKKRLENAPKPPESKFFKTGQSVSNFKTTDINGNKVNLKDLKGKLVVINFWFINCEPCRREMPELNTLVKDYKDSSNIVFLAVALDEKADLKTFLKNTPFDYDIIDGGRFITQQYSITSYPTHLILDKEGKVYYHSTGYSLVTVSWLRRSIEELFKKG